MPHVTDSQSMLFNDFIQVSDGELSYKQSRRASSLANRIHDLLMAQKNAVKAMEATNDPITTVIHDIMT